MKNISNEEIYQRLIENLLKQKEANIDRGKNILFFHANNFNCLGGKRLSDIHSNLCITNNEL